MKPEGSLIMVAVVVLLVVVAQGPEVAACACCGTSYDLAAFEALHPAAGHKVFDRRGQPVPIDGLTIKVCRTCTSSVTVEEQWPWPSRQYPDDVELHEVSGGEDEGVIDSDMHDEADSAHESARNRRMWDRATAQHGGE